MNGPTHTVGSHSDDRGGESDWPCYCDQNVAPSNSKSEDTPKCKRCGGDGFTSEHGCNPNYPESCAYTCPVQVQCEACEATGLEPPQDTSLDDIIEELVVDTFEDVVLVQVEDKIKAKRKFLAWHKAKVAKLLQVIEDEVILVQCKECEGAHFFKAVPLEALKQIKDNVINGGSL